MTQWKKELMKDRKERSKKKKGCRGHCERVRRGKTNEGRVVKESRASCARVRRLLVAMQYLRSSGAASVCIDFI